MKKIMLSALITLTLCNTLFPTIGTAETMYSDLVEPIMLNTYEPTERKWKIHDLKQRMIQERNILTHRITELHLRDQFDKKVTAGLEGAGALLFLGATIRDLYALYKGSWDNPHLLDRLLIASWSFLAVSGLSITTIYIDTLQVREYQNKVKEISRFIEKLDILLGQMCKPEEHAHYNF
jgi:hypothetical protein